MAFGYDDALMAGGMLAGGALGGALGGGGGGRARRDMLAGIDYLRSINPEAANAWLNAVENPEGRAAQMEALRQMQEIGAAGGMDPASVAAMRQAETEAAGYAGRQQGAVTQNAAARGILGGGQELALRQAAQQGGANAVAGAGSEAANAARQRALGAIAQSGQLAGGVREGDVGFQSAQLNAANYANQFNAMNRLRQGLGVQGAYGELAGQSERQGQRNAQTGTALGAGLGPLGGMAYNYFTKRP